MAYDIKLLLPAHNDNYSAGYVPGTWHTSDDLVHIHLKPNMSFRLYCKIIETSGSSVASPSKYWSGTGEATIGNPVAISTGANT